jgi:hypothetical protein
MNYQPTSWLAVASSEQQAASKQQSNKRDKGEVLETEAEAEAEAKAAKPEAETEADLRTHAHAALCHRWCSVQVPVFIPSLPGSSFTTSIQYPVSVLRTRTRSAP